MDCVNHHLRVTSHAGRLSKNSGLISGISSGSRTGARPLATPTIAARLSSGSSDARSRRRHDGVLVEIARSDALGRRRCRMLDIDAASWQRDGRDSNGIDHQRWQYSSALLTAVSTRQLKTHGP
jgi:hypothetical protein